MTMLRGRFRRRRALSLIVAGAATVAIDQRLRGPKADFGSDALMNDWRAVGGDLRGAIERIRDEFKAA